MFGGYTDKYYFTNDSRNEMKSLTTPFDTRAKTSGIGVVLWARLCGGTTSPSPS